MIAQDSSIDERAAWQELRATGSRDARERLLALHVGYARVVAATYYGRRFTDEIPFEEYLQLARIGLLEAMERFDPDRGVQFRSFAARRMHGAILNGLEKQTEKQQQIAARKRLRTGRIEQVKEMAAAATGQEAGTLREADQILEFVAEVGIGLAVCWMLDGTGMIEHAEQGETLHFYQGAALRETRERLHRALDVLSDAERTVIRRHYFQQVPFDEIAATLHLTKGRISQIHKQALFRLRNLAGEQADWSLTL